MSLIDIVAAEIDTAGPISYGRYVDLALYHPTLGFYADGGAGRRRDFITSAEVGPLFGAVVARALDAAWDDLDRPSTFSVVEAGAGSGRLARAVLAASPRCATALRYRTVEISASQRAEHPPAVDALASFPKPGGDGVVIANELLDNLPFDLYECDGERWNEVRVGHDGVGLIEIATEPDELPACIRTVDATTLEVVAARWSRRVPDHYGARDWLSQALAQHDRGRVIAIDYTVAAYPVSPDRPWLRTYRAHDVGGDPLERPGTQDITIDVAVDQLRAVRPPDRITAQTAWLRAHGIEDLVAEGRRLWNDKAAAPDVAALTARSRVSEAEALCDPAGLGAFGVVEWDIGV